MITPTIDYRSPTPDSEKFPYNPFFAEPLKEKTLQILKYDVMLGKEF